MSNGWMSRKKASLHNKITKNSFHSIQLITEQALTIYTQTSLIFMLFQEILEHPSQNRPAAGSMSRLLQRFNRLHSRWKIYYFCFVTDKNRKKLKKRLKRNSPTISYRLECLPYSQSLEFSKTQMPFWSITKGEIFIDFIRASGKTGNLPGFVVYYTLL